VQDDEIKDGAELLWIEHWGEAVSAVRSWVRPEGDLEVFGTEDEALRSTDAPTGRGDEPTP
jgi:hypothetical protein